MTNSAAAVLIMDAQDRASAKIERTRGVLEKIQQKSASTALSFVSLSGAMALTGVSIGIIGSALRGYVAGILEAQAAQSTFRNRLMLAGFSADRASSSMAALKGSTVLAGSAMANMSDESLASFMLLAPDTIKAVEQLAEQFMEVNSKLPGEKAWGAATQVVLGNAEGWKVVGLSVDSTAEGYKRFAPVLEDTRKNMTSAQKATKDFNKSLKELGTAAEPVGAELVTLGASVMGLVAKGMSGKLPIQSVIGDAVYDTLHGDTAPAISVGVFIGDLMTQGLAGRIVREGPTFASTTVEMISTGIDSVSSQITSKGGELADNLWHGFRDSLIAGLNWVIENVLNRFLSTVEGALNVANRLSGGVIPSVSLGRVGLISNPADEARRAAEIRAEAQRMDEAAAPFESLNPAFPSPNRGRPSSTTLNVQVGDRTLTQIVLDIIDGEVRIREPSLGLR